VITGRSLVSWTPTNDQSSAEWSYGLPRSIRRLQGNSFSGLGFCFVWIQENWIRNPFKNALPKSLKIIIAYTLKLQMNTMVIWQTNCHLASLRCCLHQLFIPVRADGMRVRIWRNIWHQFAGVTLEFCPWWKRENILSSAGICRQIFSNKEKSHDLCYRYRCVVGIQDF
jgi:hypothetical protein